MKNYFKTSFLNRWIPRLEQKSTGILFYGKNNLLPNDIIKYINESGVAKNCVRTLAQFIQADGFSDTNVAEIKTGVWSYDSLLGNIATQWSYAYGFALYVYRFADGTIAKVEPAPFEAIRKFDNGDFEVNVTYGQPDYKKDAAKKHPPYRGRVTDTTQVLKDKNEFESRPEIFYSYIKTPDNPNYPVPDFFAGIEDIITSSELCKFDLSTVRNGFVTSAILTIIGELDDEVEGKDGLTDMERFEEELKKFTGEVKDANGLTGQNRMMVLNAPSTDTVPVLQPFDAKAIYDASNTKREVIERSVCRLFGIHPVLLGYSDAAVLGNQQALSNAVALLNNKVNAIQRHISSAFNELFGEDIDFTISTFTPYQFIAPEIMQVLTTDEKRAIAGYSPLTITDAVNQ